jgi:hypothetical protein
MQGEGGCVFGEYRVPVIIPIPTERKVYRDHSKQSLALPATAAPNLRRDIFLNKADQLTACMHE